MYNCRFSFLMHFNWGKTTASHVMLLLMWNNALGRKSGIAWCPCSTAAVIMLCLITHFFYVLCNIFRFSYFFSLLIFVFFWKTRLWVDELVTKRERNLCSFDDLITIAIANKKNRDTKQNGSKFLNQVILEVAKSVTIGFMTFHVFESLKMLLFFAVRFFVENLFVAREN